MNGDKEHPAVVALHVTLTTTVCALLVGTVILAVVAMVRGVDNGWILAVPGGLVLFWGVLYLAIVIFRRAS